MAFRFSKRSLERMEGVHPHLVAVMHRALELTPIDFTVLEGVRSLDRQKELVANGASQTMNSRHLIADNGVAHAIDIAPYVDGTVSWHWPHYHTLAPAVKQAALELNVPIEWGGDWKSFKDGPHWQLPWAEYQTTRPVTPLDPFPRPPQLGDDLEQRVADLERRMSDAEGKLRFLGV